MCDAHNTRRRVGDGCEAHGSGSSHDFCDSSQMVGNLLSEDGRRGERSALITLGLSDAERRRRAAGIDFCQLQKEYGGVAFCDCAQRWNRARFDSARISWLSLVYKYRWPFAMSIRA